MRLIHEREVDNKVTTVYYDDFSGYYHTRVVDRLTDELLFVNVSPDEPNIDEVMA